MWEAGGAALAAEGPVHEPQGLRLRLADQEVEPLCVGGYPKKGYTWAAAPGGEGWVRKAGLHVHRRQEQGIGDAGPQKLPL